MVWMHGMANGVSELVMLVQKLEDFLEKGCM
jgi:hypothetical protein